MKPEEESGREKGPVTKSTYLVQQFGCLEELQREKKELLSQIKSLSTTVRAAKGKPGAPAARWTIRPKGRRGLCRGDGLWKPELKLSASETLH